MPELQSPVWELEFASPGIRLPAFLAKRYPEEAAPFVVLPKN